MKVLLVSTNRIRRPVPVLPIGAAMVYQSMVSSGHEGYFLDLMFEKHPEKALRSALHSFRPEAVCLSVRNLDNQVMQHPCSYLSQIKKIAALCRREQASRLIVGGAAMRVAGVALVDALNADYGITGPGESELVRLLGDLESGQQMQRLYVGKELFDPRWSRIPPPSLFSPSYFAQDARFPKPVIGYQTTRGCRCGCVYCSYAGYPVERVPEEVLRTDLQRLTREYGTSRILITDDLFNPDVEGTVEICEAILRTGTGISWTCSMSPTAFSRELIVLMKRAGCVFVDLGIDSGSDEMLRNLGKGFHSKKIIELAGLLEMGQIPYSVSLLFGGPGECERTIRETVATVNLLHPQYVLASMGLRVYPGTHLARWLWEEGSLTDLKNPFQMRFYCSPTFSPAILRRCLATSIHPYKTMMMRNF